VSATAWTAIVLAFFVGVATSFFTLPLWVIMMINAAKAGSASDWLGFSGSVIAGLMTLTGAIIAWFAVQLQIRSQERTTARAEIIAQVAKDQQNADSKIAAVIGLTQPIHVASMLLYSVRTRLAAKSKPDIAQWQTATDQACAQLKTALEHFSLREISADLAIDDRAPYLIVLSQLSSIVNIYERPVGILPRVDSLKLLRDQLEHLEGYLRPFDGDLADAFLRDSADPAAQSAAPRP
jgi:hypothetical protein